MASRLIDMLRSDLAPCVVGMLHAPPLPGSPRFGGSISAVRAALLDDAEALQAGGVDALMLENFGDVPFHPGPVPAVTLAHMTELAALVRRHAKLPLGINLLRNDGCGALAVAHAVGADFIRVNVLCGARVADQGLLQGIAHDLLRLRSQLQAQSIAILADVDVKHSTPLGHRRSLADEAHDTIERGLADAIIVSGQATGSPTDLDHLQQARHAAGATPVLVGSGITIENAATFAPHADGLIVGTALKHGAKASHPVDRDRVKALMAALRSR